MKLGIPLLGMLALTMPPSAAAAQGAGPEYSLVAARELGHVDRRHMGCIGLGDRVICPEYRSASYDEARALAGPPVEPRFSIATEVPEGAGWARPLLLVIRNLPDRQSRVVAAAPADGSGMACIATAELDRLGWRPSGPDIVTTAERLCVDLSPLAALPPPKVEAVTVIGVEDARRILPRRAKRRR